MTSDGVRTATITLPLSPGRYALLQADWPLSNAEWEQLQVLLTAMRPGLVMPLEAEALVAVFAWLGNATSLEERQTAFLREHEQWNGKVEQALSELDEVVDEIDRSPANHARAGE